MAGPPLGRVEALFHRAVDLAPAERAGLLDAECAGDPALRAAVEELLRLDDLGETSILSVSPVERTWTGGLRKELPFPFGEARLAQALPGYELLEVLGKGGMGVVFQARQLSLDRLVAVKMLLSAAPVMAEEAARFRTEAE